MRISITRPTSSAPNHSHANRSAILVAGPVLLLARCGDKSDEASPSAGTSVTAENCGVDVTVDHPSKRVYAAHQPAAEVASALAISDRLVGSAFFDGAFLPEYAARQKDVPYSANLPTREALLKTKPDFVFGGLRHRVRR